MTKDDPSKEDIEEWLDSLETSQSAIPRLPPEESMYGDDRQILGWDPDSDGPDCFVRFDSGELYRVDTFVDAWTGEVEGESYEDVMAPSEEDEETAE